MEVLRSTHIVFGNHDSARGDGLTPIKGTVYKNTKSPAFDQKAKPSKARKSDMGSVTPIKGQLLESPFRQNFVLPPHPMSTTPSIESPIHAAHAVHAKEPELPAPKPKELKEPALVQTYSYSSPKKGVSPTDSGIGLTPASLGMSPLSISPPKMNPKIRTMYKGSMKENDDEAEYPMNPDPVPFQPSNFMSSTMMKKVPMSRRHLDSFGSIDLATGMAKRGMMLHTDRYQWDIARALDGLSQRERLQAEIEYMERLRGIKRRREVLPHRAQLDLLMGGKKMEFTERFEIQREIQKLKSLILPQHAKDLFHGRGFVLPDGHNSLKPRRFLPTDIDFEDDLGPFSPDKYSFNPETGRVHPKGQRSDMTMPGALPNINKKGYLLGHGSPIILSKEKRTVESIKARLRIPTKNFRAQKGEPIPVKTPNPFTLGMEDTWTPFVTRQSTMTSPTQPLQPQGNRSPGLPYSPRKRYRDKPDESPDLTLYPTSQSFMMSPRYGTGVSQPPYMTRSKTNVTSGHTKHATNAGRSLTAHPVKKDAGHHPAATAPTIGKIPGGKDIKIPVSVHDEEEGAPKPTPNRIEEEPSGRHVDVDEWLDLEEEIDLPKDDEDRQSVARSLASPSKAQTPNPLKATEIVRSLSVEEQTRLKHTFDKLDTDKDGHLKFSQLQTQLPKQFSQSQERYIKQVYELTSSSTFFGVDEFMTMSYLTNIVTDLRGEPLDAYNHIDFQNLHQVIHQYVDLFQTVDRTHRGKISLDSLQSILSSALSIDLKSDTEKWTKIIDTISLSEPSLISKIEFLANIPYFESGGRK